MSQVSSEQYSLERGQERSFSPAQFGFGISLYSVAHFVATVICTLLSISHRMVYAEDKTLIMVAFFEV